MPKRLTSTPPLYVKKHEWFKRAVVHCFIFFTLLNTFGYLYYDDTNAYINPSGVFTRQCDSTESSYDIKIDVDIDLKDTESHVGVETNFTSSSSLSSLSDKEINQKYCGKSKCKFLFAYYQPEQETKANTHFRSFVNLAQALNRTMVLTNVGNSRINSCQNFTFGFYYNDKSLKEMFPNVTFISQKDFQNWLKERKEKPNTEHAYILPGDSTNYSMEYVKPYPDILRKKHCLDLFDFKLNDQTIFKQFYTGNNFTRDIETHENVSNFLVENLKSDTEILLTSHFVFHSLFPKVSLPIPYSNHYLEEASKIINRIKPYVAIHWRMERANINMLPECANMLVKRINQLEESYGFKNIYFATDYPMGGGVKTQSQTFHLLTENHHDAIRILNSTFNLNTWVSSDIFSHLKNEKMIEKEFFGAGMPGIVDKLVCIDADYFLATPEGCGRARSTYTTMIINTRDRFINRGDKPHLRNIAERWIHSPEEEETN